VRSRSADWRSMGFLPAVLPRLVAIAAAALLAVTTATVTFAATRGPSTAAGEPAELVVPDVRRQAFVFAKGSLEEAGFAWMVKGKIRGYAANTVVAQRPAPWTKVRDTGAPTITLTLVRNPRYAQEGTPEDVSPYRATAIRLVDPPVARRNVTAAAKPVAKPKAKHAARPKAKPAKRIPAFVVAGAPAEPLDEITLDARARLLERWLAKHPEPTNANVQHWLYQHAWIVTGTRFGWSHGEAALQILVAVDRKAEARWEMGSRSRTVAEQALAEVQAKSR
jgi:hypothetical protein